jgi:hypothetical protein
MFSGIAALVIYRIIRQDARHDWRLDMALASLTPLLFSPLIEQALVRLAEEKYTAHTPTGLRQAAVLIWIVGVSAALLSLPATFLVNFVANHWPQWFILHARMFYVLLAVFLTVVWLYRRPVTTGQRISRVQAFEH